MNKRRTISAFYQSKKFFPFALSLLFCLITFSGNSSAFAAYSNPKLRVLLFKTSAPVKISSRGVFYLEGLGQIPGRNKTISVKRLNSKTLLLNGNSKISKKLIINSTRKIKVRGRNYVGKIEIRPYRYGVYVINHIRTERYLEGVLNAEINTSWPNEVLKAQTIIARTYALYKRRQRRNKLWHLSASSWDQVYKGIDISDPPTRKAIMETKGIVVSRKGRLVPTFYHSNSGGITEDPGNIWQYSLPHLKVKKSPYGKADPRYYWEVTFNGTQLERILRKAGIRLKNPNDIMVSKRTSSGRAKTLVFGGDSIKSIPAKKFRTLAGNNYFQSLLFDVEVNGEDFIFRGTGHGHGVGLDQWGAKEMAEEGNTFKQIINFYYNQISLKRYQG